MIQIRSPFLVVYADRMRLPSMTAALLRLLILVVDVTPVAGHVAGEELTGLLICIPKDMKGSRRGDDPPEAELLGSSGSRVLGVRPISAAHNAVGLAGESPVVGIDCLPT